MVINLKSKIMSYQCPNCSNTKFILAEDVNVENQLFLNIKTVKCSNCHTVIGVISPDIEDLKSDIEKMEERLEVLERLIKQ